MQLYIIPLGKCDNDKEKIFTPGKNHGDWLKVPIWAAVIKTSELNILIDTGMHPGHIKHPNMTFEGTELESAIVPIMTEDDRMENRLSEIGLTPEDIHVVINTHLHFDHSGNNNLFPYARIIIQKQHFEQAKNNPNVFPHRYFMIEDLNYDLIDGEMELLPNISIIRSPGHAIGMQNVVVNLKNSGTIILAGDSISLEEHLLDNNWDGYEDPKNARISGLRLKEIKDLTGGTILFGHDSKQWESLKISPSYYD